MKPSKFTPEPIYMNHQDGAAYIHLSPDQLKMFFEQGLINRYPRKGEGFRYKIKELIALADQIDLGNIKVA